MKSAMSKPKLEHTVLTALISFNPLFQDENISVLEN
jgi:hypothetical protein